MAVMENLRITYIIRMHHLQTMNVGYSLRSNPLSKGQEIWQDSENFDLLVVSF